ncbi:hypothetical protein EON64_06885, partial [archaeon]
MHHGPGGNKGRPDEAEGENDDALEADSSPSAEQREAPQPEQPKSSSSAPLRESKEKPRPRSQPQRPKKIIAPDGSAKVMTEPAIESPVPLEKPLMRTRSAAANTADPVKRVEAVLQQKQKLEVSASNRVGGRGPILVAPLSPPSPVSNIHSKSAPLLSPEALVNKNSQPEEPVRIRSNHSNHSNHHIQIQTQTQLQTSHGGNGSNHVAKQSSRAEPVTAAPVPPPAPVPVPAAARGTGSDSSARRASLSDIPQSRPHSSAALREESAAESSETLVHNAVLDMAIRVVVRKRPLSRSESQRGEKDVLEIDRGGVVMVHEPKVKVDLTKVVETQSFVFDDAFDAYETNVALYSHTVKPLVSFLFQGGKGSCFAYGQTGSGKTFSMMGSDPANPLEQSSNAGLYVLAGKDIFDTIKRKKLTNIKVNVSCFEIYGGKLFDLLNNRAPIKCLEDARQQVHLPGLTSHTVQSVAELLGLMARAHSNRSTGSTGA